MLGYTLADCERLYVEAVGDVPDYYDPPPLSYAEYAAVLKRVKLARIRLPEDGDYDLGEYVSQTVMRDPQFSEADRRLGTLTKDDGTFFENLDPYVTLRLLAENPENLDHLVIWRFVDVVEGGYVEEEDIYEGVPPRQVCLIVTEGSSDSAILKESLPKIAPDLIDFFDFVDMSENYPFTGTGNLVRFAQGLARIRIQNRILMVVDNDTAGQSAFRRISALKLPERMRVVTLPDLESCRRFDTLGPSGPGVEDINGRAVSIELFLDLSRSPESPPTVRWTAYDEALSQYQGELLNKEAHVKRFLEATRRSQTYDYEKLGYLWQYLIDVTSRAPVPGV